MSALNHSLSHLSREAAEKSIPEMNQREGEILVEKVSEKLAHTEIGPAAVYQEEALQVSKLGEGEVTGQHGLHPLLPADPHPNVSR